MAFDFGSSAPAESDPTADFLARERAAAGSLSGDADLFGSSHAGVADKDFESSASAFPSLDGDDAPTPAAAAAPATFVDDDDLLGGGSASAAPPAPKDELSQFQSNFSELEEELPVPSAPSVSSSERWLSLRCTDAVDADSFMCPTCEQHNNGYSAPAAASQPPIQQSYAADPYAQEPTEEPEAVK